jgi:hypothetical protein
VGVLGTAYLLVVVGTEEPMMVLGASELVGVELVLLEASSYGARGV